MQIYIKMAKSNQICYLGHISSNLSDDADIARQCRKLYAQRNMLIKQFHMYSVLLFNHVYLPSMVTIQAEQY